MKTRMIIVAGPSGVGKSSFVEAITKIFPILLDTVTCTTRPMRAGESPGHPYEFISTELFESRIQQNYFVEWARVHSSYYGTPKDQIDLAFAQNRVVIMDVDVQGVATFKAKYPDAKTIFIHPPSIEELRRRIQKRDGKEPKDIEVRMTNAANEIKKADQFDFQLVNEDFETSFAAFKKIVEGLLEK